MLESISTRITFPKYRKMFINFEHIILYKFCKKILLHYIPDLARRELSELVGVFTVCKKLYIVNYVVNKRISL